MTLIAPMCPANDLSPAHFQKELLPLPTGTYLDSQVLDLNGDGIPDLAAVSFYSLYVLLGDGSGNFSQPTPYNPGRFFVGLASGDFNSDGFPDAVIANFPGINILLNNGSGGFPTSVFINTSDQFGIRALDRQLRGSRS